MRTPRERGKDERTRSANARPPWAWTWQDAAAELSQLEAAARLARVTLLHVRGQIDQHEAACGDLREFIDTLADQKAARQAPLEATRQRSAAAWEQLRAQAHAQEASRRRLIKTSQQLARSERQLTDLQATIERLAREGEMP